jgi:hypothetical protein
VSSNPLENLARIGQLAEVPESPELARRILEAARARMRDARVAANSAQTRFDCAYGAIRSAADVGLLLAGYRTPTNRPGHHQTAIQSLVHTLRLDPASVRVLDALRKLRNVAEYDGEPVTEASLEACLQWADDLVDRAERALVARGWSDPAHR